MLRQLLGLKYVIQKQKTQEMLYMRENSSTAILMRFYALVACAKDKKFNSLFYN